MCATSHLLPSLLNHSNGELMAYEITEDCISCGMCADECPSDAIKQDGILYRIDQELCTECGTCEETCPRKTVIRTEREAS